MLRWHLADECPQPRFELPEPAQRFGCDGARKAGVARFKKLRMENCIERLVQRAALAQYLAENGFCGRARRDGARRNAGRRAALRHLSSRSRARVPAPSRSPALSAVRRVLLWTGG